MNSILRCRDEVLTAGFATDVLQTSTQFATINSHLESSSDIERTISEAVGYVFLMISLLYFCMVCALSGRIGLAIEVIKVAGQTVKYTKLLFLVPVVNWVCLPRDPCPRGLDRSPYRGISL